MDFINLAQSSWDLHRHLAERSESVVRMLQTDGTDLTDGNQHRPLLSPSAEAELYLLASNFLLYVALVIITTLIAKVYFPSSLEPRHKNPTGSSPYNYKGYYQEDENDDDGEEEDDEYDEDNDEYDDDDESDSDGEIEDEFLDSGEEENGLYNIEEADVLPDFATRPKTRPGARNSIYEDVGTVPTFTSARLMEFDQDSMSKPQVLKQLIFCTLMLNITFVSWGVLQERMLTQPYPDSTGENSEYFRYSYALVFTNRCWTAIISGILLLYLRPHRSRTTIVYEYTFPSISNMLSSWCQYEALQYVTFPALTLFKSFKLAPVMAMGKLLGNKTYPSYDYLVAIFIGIGITMFMTSTDDLQLGYDVYGEASPVWTGVMLLILYLFFDSFTSQWQSRMFQRHRDLSMAELMFATSIFSTMLSFVTLIHDKELQPALNFARRHSEIFWHFLIFSICSTIGQIFIFYTIKNFGAVVFTLIMTTRVLLSIALSCVLYGHKVTGIGFLGLMMVLGAVLYRIKRKAEGKPLVRWQGIDDDKAQELVKEWHEHADM